MKPMRIVILAIGISLVLQWHSEADAKVKAQLKVGAASVAVTPYGNNPRWDGTITASGVWGESFDDKNGNHVWDAGEPFQDDEGNTALDNSSRNKYDGIYLAGFGQRRLATGKHDDIWARTIVLDYGTTRIAVVAIDVIGYYSEARYYGIKQISSLLDPKLGIQEILLASTHNHEGPDTIGPWGHGALNDGKYPKYLRFLDREIARSIELAAAQLQPVKIKLGQTDAKRAPELQGMQVRTSGRPPHFFDDELRLMQFVGIAGSLKGKTVATLINWNTHPESMENKNTLLTSDFCHSIREKVEQQLGGTAVYINGAIGAAEIIGDTNRKNDDRSIFDGKTYVLPEIFGQTDKMFERTMAIGRDVAKAALAALAKGEWSKSNALLVKKADVYGPMDNEAYLTGARIGILDTLAIPNDAEIKAGKRPAFQTQIYALQLGDAQIVTTPGELFPEVFYGVAQYKRNDCPQADTGEPTEPSIRAAMTAKYRFMFGLCPDELGYIVPRYDWRREPFDAKKLELKEAADPCGQKGVPTHYHETNSASSVLAPATACVSVALLSGKFPSAPACRGTERYSKYLQQLLTLQSKK